MRDIDLRQFSFTSPGSPSLRVKALAQDSLNTEEKVQKELGDH
jgi:hypothetical protein